MSKRVHKYGVFLVYGIAFLLCVYAVSGCSLLSCPVDEPAARFAEDYADAREDGTIDPPEMKMLDRDCGYVEDALDEKGSGFNVPTTGIPWLDAAMGVGGLLLTGLGTHKYTMRKRDKTAPERVKKALEKTA
jgi:hypothetical protein